MNMMKEKMDTMSMPAGITINIEHLSIHMDERMFNHNNYFNGCDCEAEFEEFESDEGCDACHEGGDCHKYPDCPECSHEVDAHHVNGMDIPANADSANQKASVFEEKLMDAFIQAVLQDALEKGGEKDE